jgi:transcriptional regulator with XRE-family HTH domain
MLSKNLQEILKNKKLNISELSRCTGVPKSNISSWMSGANPNVHQLIKVADYLKVDLEYLVTGKNKITINILSRGVTWIIGISS